MSHKDKRLFNYVVNTLGLTKTMVLEYADKRLEELIDKVLHGKMNSNHVESLILNRITQIVNDGVSTQQFSGYYRKQAFEDYVKKIVKAVIEEKVNLETSIEVKLVRKDKSVVGKSE